MKKIIIGAVGVAITAGTLLVAPPAMADPDAPHNHTLEITDDGPFPTPLQLVLHIPRLKHEPIYGPQGSGLGARQVRSVHSAYSIPASNPTA